MSGGHPVPLHSALFPWDKSLPLNLELGWCPENQRNPHDSTPGPNIGVLGVCGLSGILSNPMHDAWLVNVRGLPNFLTWVLRDCPQVFMLVQQTQFSMSHLPCPFIWLFIYQINIYLFIQNINVKACMTLCTWGSKGWALSLPFNLVWDSFFCWFFCYAFQASWSVKFGDYFIII